MKCLILFVLYLFSFFSSVYSLGLSITSLVGYTAVVQWTREEFDPDPLTFDLRFVVPPYYDVGLAVANVSPGDIESYGNVTVQFSQAGRYILVAVSGSRALQIGRTPVVEVPGNTTVSTLSPTPSPTTSPTSQTPTPSSTTALSHSKEAKKKPNVPAIVSGVLGGVLLSALLIFVVLYFRRRRPHEGNRISFHGERMVKPSSSDRHNPSIRTVQREGSRIIPYPFSSPRQSFGSTQPSNGSARQSNPESLPQDVERGLAVPPPVMTSLPSESIQTPLASAHIVPPPRGPRDRSKSVRRLESARTPRTYGEPTARQRKLAEKLAEVEKQIAELKLETKPRPSTVVLLDDLEMKKTWLVKQRDTLWALEEIDTLPPGYSRYMM